MGHPRSKRLRNGNEYRSSIWGFTRELHRFSAAAAGRNLPWLRTLREDAFARFAEAGFPTTHDEDWRFTNVSPIARTQFRLPGKTFVQLPPAELNSWHVEGVCRTPGIREWAVCAGAVGRRRLPKGVAVSSLREQIEGHSGSDSRSNSAIMPTRSAMHLLRLNTAFVEDGAYVHVKRGVVVEAPIHLLFVSSSDHAAADVASAQSDGVRRPESGARWSRITFRSVAACVFERRDRTGRGERTRTSRTT